MKNLLFILIGVSFLTSCDTNVREVDIVLHDWECRYIIQDGYNQRSIPHYVNNYTLNVDGSISFTNDEGETWRIPYPYYAIEENAAFD